MGIKGYKVFNPDWTCRGFQYEVGKTYKHEGNIEMCGAGFHFCQKISDCFNYYDFNSDNKVAEVEAVGLVETKNDKSVTNEIVIHREITWHEVLNLANTGSNCTGNYNSGDYNSGDCNSGDRNSGNCNSGNYNSGDCNSGDYNSGDYNSGDCNSGNYNSGNYNSGDYNSGNWNSTNFSTGFFNSIEQPLYAFDKPLDVDRDTFNDNIGMKAMIWKFENEYWIYSENMTEEEKKTHPEYELTGGYLKTVSFKTACSMMWNNMTDDEKEAVKQLPNFDGKIFKKITGIKIN